MDILIFILPHIMQHSPTFWRAFLRSAAWTLLGLLGLPLAALAADGPLTDVPVTGPHRVHTQIEAMRKIKVVEQVFQRRKARYDRRLDKANRHLTQATAVQDSRRMARYSHKIKQLQKRGSFGTGFQLLLYGFLFYVIGAYIVGSSRSSDPGWIKPFGYVIMVIGVLAALFGIISWFVD